MAGVRENRYMAPLAEGRARFGIPADALVGFVSVADQTLDLFDADGFVASMVVSTAAAGVNARAGSGGTPPGWHRVTEIFGEGLPAGTVFSSRMPTGAVLPPAAWRAGTGDRILTRIFWLSGLEPGVNAGPGLDTHDRYVYLHGTNDEDGLGTPCSHGCVRLGNFDAVRLADLAVAHGRRMYVSVG